MKGISYAEVKGKKTLIRGEVGKGKTCLLSRLLTEAIETEEAASITVIDMAPREISAGGIIVGGKLATTELAVIRHFAPEQVVAPRLKGTTSEEVVQLANQNANTIEPYLAQYIASPTPVLFANDLTIYLHRGKAELLREAITLAKTFVGTAYWGSFFDDKGSGINTKERLLLGQLMDLFELVVDL